MLFIGALAPCGEEIFLPENSLSSAYGAKLEKSQ
jgi:hypothetical protein